MNACLSNFEDGINKLNFSIENNVNHFIICKRRWQQLSTVMSSQKKPSGI